MIALVALMVLYWMLQWISLMGILLALSSVFVWAASSEFASAIALDLLLHVLVTHFLRMLLGMHLTELLGLVMACVCENRSGTLLGWFLGSVSAS